MLSSLLLLFFFPSLLNVLLVKILLSVFRCVLMSFSLNFSFEVYCWLHSHKKRKDSLESSLYWVLFAAELDFLKILVPNLSQHTSNVNIYRKIRMAKATVLFIWDKFLAALIHLFFYFDINLFLIDHYLYWSFWGTIWKIATSHFCCFSGNAKVSNFLCLILVFNFFP